MTKPGSKSICWEDGQLFLKIIRQIYWNKVLCPPLLTINTVCWNLVNDSSAYSIYILRSLLFLIGYAVKPFGDHLSEISLGICIFDCGCFWLRRHISGETGNMWIQGDSKETSKYQIPEVGGFCVLIARCMNLDIMLVAKFLRILVKTWTTVHVFHMPKE